MGKRVEQAQIKICGFIRSSRKIVIYQFAYDQLIFFPLRSNLIFVFLSFASHFFTFPYNLSFVAPYKHRWMLIEVEMINHNIMHKKSIECDVNKDRLRCDAIEEE
jgi:hypothetical protein